MQWDAPLEGLLEQFRRSGRRRVAFVADPETGRLSSSAPELEGLALQLRQAFDYRGHEACFLELGAESEHLLGAFLHRTTRGQGAGGVRFWSYETVGDFLRDGLRLSRGMGHKNALAGLWWGGGKGVIARRPKVDFRDPAVRKAVYRDYGRFISSLRGCYVTAEDVGTTPCDMANVFTQTRYTTCIPPQLGGSGNPSELTARGVVVAMEAALEFLGLGSLEGKRVAMQGLGNVARFMLRDLFARGVERVIAVDLDARRVEEARRAFPDAPLEVTQVAAEDRSILAAPADVVAPNAVGGILDDETIPGLAAPVVCGAANNQLADPARHGDALTVAGRLYVPDFLANRMGIVHCANEQYGSFPGDPAIEAHLDRETPHGIHRRCLEVFERARSRGTSTAAEALALADELMEEPHPLWPGRSSDLVRHLWSSGWADG